MPYVLIDLESDVIAKISYEYQTVLSNEELTRLAKSKTPPIEYELRPRIEGVQFLQSSYNSYSLILTEYQINKLQNGLKQVLELTPLFYPLNEWENLPF